MKTYTKEEVVELLSKAANAVCSMCRRPEAYEPMDQKKQTHRDITSNTNEWCEAREIWKMIEDIK